MKNVWDCVSNCLAFAIVLLTTLGVSGTCSAARLTKANREAINGELVGVVVLQAQSSEAGGVPEYLLCEGKHVSSIDQKGATCDENARVLLKITGKPLGQVQMAVLEDAARKIGHVKRDPQVLVFTVPNGTTAFVMKPASNFDAGRFRLLGTLELHHGLATLSTNLVVKGSKDTIYVPIQEIDPASSRSQIQPDERIALLVSAKTVFVISTGQKAPSGVGGFLTKMATEKYSYADAESAQREVIAAVNGSERWTLVDAADKADLVLSIDETNSSMGAYIIDRLWVFKGGSIPDRSTTQPLWFCLREQIGQSASKVASWLQEDMKILTELESQKVTAVMPLDIELADTLAKPSNQFPSTPAVTDRQNTQQSAPEAMTAHPDNLPSLAKEPPKPSSPPSDVKAYLLSSKTIFVRGELGQVARATRGYLNPNPERGESSVTNVLTKWGRYQVVNDPVRADLIAVITESNRVILGIQEQLRSNLSVYAAGFDSADAKPLWTGDAKEAFTKMPSTKVAEDFCKFVDKLQR